MVAPSLELLDDLTALPAAAWNGLLDRQASPTPFLRHEWLCALVDSGSATQATGWGPRVLALRDELGGLRAACPLYLKAHSWGEYVFDWAWADAYERHGLAYYPKLLCAVPFTPVPGSRLLATTDDDRRLLLRGLVAVAQRLQLSSVHLLFSDEAEQAAAEAEGWLMRRGVQFHWTQRQPQPYADFADFLASLQREKRKKIAQERRRVAEAGVTFTVHEGTAIGEGLWDFFYRCHTLTYRAHGSRQPYLSRDFFHRLAATVPGHWLMFVAHREGRPIACSLVAIDRARRTAWGRYWGAVEHVPLLHFEACYYQPLQWCIDQGFDRFEGGAQGEHKMARGLLPVATASAHWLAHPQFSAAVADFLEREAGGVDAYLDELNERSPFKATPA
jgi:predicted N-acyltransferase